MKSKTSRIRMLLLTTLAALLFSMMLVPAGFAKVRVGKGDWVKYSAFTGLNYTSSVSDDLWADRFSAREKKWTRIGPDAPYVDEIDYTNYINATADSQKIGDFGFENLSDGTISEVYIELYCKQVANEKIRVWYSTDGGSNWIDSGTLTPEGDWGWLDTGDESANIDTWAKVNSTLVYLESVADGAWGGDVTVDCMRLHIERIDAHYAPPNLWNLGWYPPDYWPETTTEWINMAVQNVSDSYVTVESTTHFENCTEKTKTLSGNVTAGSGNVGFFLIETDQTEDGEEILWDHTGVTGAGCKDEGGLPIKLYVNGTVSREYAGVSRKVNYVNVTMVGLGPTHVNLEAYWDKATGVLCEILMLISFGPISTTRGIIDARTSFKMTETNVFEEAPIWTEWWFWVIIAVIVAAAAGSGILIWRRGKGT